MRRNVASGDGRTDEVIRIKRWNKVEALKLMAQRIGLLEERVTHNVGPNIELILRGRQRLDEHPVAGPLAPLRRAEAAGVQRTNGPASAERGVHGAGDRIQ